MTRLSLAGGGIGLMLLVLLVVVVIGTGGSLLAGADGIDPYEYEEDYVDDYLEDYAGSVTAHRVVDPWVPEDPELAPPVGRRYVAIEVTVENDTGADLGVYAGSGQFKLKDDDNFVQDAIDYDGPHAEPQLPEVSLEVGEKARGWVTFEMDEDAAIASLSYWTKDVPLP